MQKLCILVCGTHRSGTSAVTRFINLLGADIARDLIPARPDNIRGFWESEAVIQIHDALLSAIGSLNCDPLDPISFPAGWENSPAAQCAKHRLMKVIERDFSGSDTFVIKDPRISRLLPVWIDLLEEMHIEPVIVIPFRNPLEVAASLTERSQVHLSKALLLYLHSYLETELASRQVPRLFIQYDELLRDWRSCQNQLDALSGKRFPPPSALIKAEVEQFLTDDLHHHMFTRDQLLTHPKIPAVVIEQFDGMCSAADMRDDMSLRALSDRFRGTCEQMGQLYRTFVMAERQALLLSFVAERKELIEAFEHSTSWRITAPLRWAKTIAARFARFDPSIGFLGVNLPAPLKRIRSWHAHSRMAVSLPTGPSKQQQGTT
jgi:hypothetical protein